MGGATCKHTLEAHTLFTYSADSGKENMVSGMCQPAVLIHVWLTFISVVLSKPTSEGNTQKGVHCHVDIQNSTS